MTTNLESTETPLEECSDDDNKISGYLVDLYCINRTEHGMLTPEGTNIATAPWEHSWHCMYEVDFCVSSGFGLVQLNEDITLKHNVVFECW
jgi:hypothetical protein